MNNANYWQANNILTLSNDLSQLKLEMILWFLLLKRTISNPAARDYSPCIVEDGGTVEIAASTGTYVGLRQGCEINEQMKYWNEFR